MTALEDARPVVRRRKSGAVRRAVYLRIKKANRGGKMGSQHGHDNLPARIRRGHSQDCPECRYTGKKLMDHLERKHPGVRERYERTQRGVWVLADEGEDAGEGAAKEGDEKEAREEVENLREELQEKERRVAKLEARLEEKEERIEELRETRDTLVENSGEALALLPELADGATDSEAVGFDRERGIMIEGGGGMTESVDKKQTVEQVKKKLNEGWEGEGENGQD